MHSLTTGCYLAPKFNCGNPASNLMAPLMEWSPLPETASRCQSGSSIRNRSNGSYVLLPKGGSWPVLSNGAGDSNGR